MAGQLKISGSLVAGPPASVTSAFPSMGANAALSTKSDPKGFGRATGILCRTENFVVFTDLGEPGNTVKAADMLYFKSSGVCQIRLTFDDGANPDIVSIIPVDGLFILEVPSANFLKLLELLGNVSLEYFLSGQT